MIAGSLLTASVNLNGPGRYLHWSIFTVSEANLVLIAVMVVIFGAALVIPFPGHGRDRQASPAEVADGDAGPLPASEGLGDGGDDADAGMWTARLRRLALRHLPPGKLLPDRQPAYVASWIYVFGVATLAALAVVIVSGFAIALGGTAWWHTDPVGHFFNSLHMWSVEAFMAFMVIHLWGKFWMAAWRGKRALTWVTGVVAFMASVVECFTGYLSQQNFDSQWISTSGKDAFDAVGVGAFFNLMNVGQMLLWHVVLIPVVLVAIVGAHILAVRVRGVVHPLPVKLARGRAARRAAAVADAASWRGATRRYDILKEATVASVVALVLVVALAWLLSSPDVPPVTVSSWAQIAPADFVATAATELAGTSETATYGPPYNDATGSTQSLLFAPAKIAGVRQPIDAAETFVLAPLSKIAPTDPTLAAALDRYQGASSTTRGAWDAAYLKAVAKVTFRPRHSRDARGPRRSRASHAGHRIDPGPQRGHRRRPPGQSRLLRDRLHQAASVLGGWPVLQQRGHSSAPHRGPVGCHERNGELSRPALAVALHPLVPGARLRQLGQRRPHRDLPHRCRHHPPPGHPLPPRTAGHPPPRPRPPAHLA